MICPIIHLHISGCLGVEIMVETKKKNSCIINQNQRKCIKVENIEIDSNGYNSNLKILVIFNSIIKAVGGASRHILEVVNYWIPENKITFLISEAGYEVAREYLNTLPGKSVVTYRVPLDQSAEKIVHLPRLLKSILLSLKLRKKNYDIVIAPNYIPWNTIPALFFKGKATLIVYFHGGPPFLRRKELREKGKLRMAISMIGWEFCVFIARFYDLIFVVETSTKEYFIEKGFDSQRLAVIGNGIPFKEISEININRKEYDGVFLGQLIKRKTRDLIDIWREVVKIIPDAKLCVIGNGPEKRILEEQAKKYNLNIEIKGWVSDKMKYEFMKRSKVFVFPSYYESWGIAIAESMACGLPVVTYDQPSYDEIFGNAIIKVNVGDVKEMAKKISHILKNYTNYEDNIKKGMLLVSKYDWKDIATYELLNIQKISKSWDSKILNVK